MIGDQIDLAAEKFLQIQPQPDLIENTYAFSKAYDQVYIAFRVRIASCNAAEHTYIMGTVPRSSCQNLFSPFAQIGQGDGVSRLPEQDYPSCVT